MPGAHARLSPSAASIWMNCPGAPVMQHGVPDTTSEHAERGTAAHELLELIITGRPTPADYVMSNGVKLDSEDLDAVQFAVEWLDQEVSVDDGDEIETETRLKFNDDLWGTCDFSRYRPEDKELLVVDYKHGAGIPVEAEGNYQGLIYALMKIKSLGNRGISKVRFVIIQPRCFHADGPVREAEIDPVDMLDIEDEIIEAIEQVKTADDFSLDPIGAFADLFLKRGDHCRWCKANFAGGCPLVQADIDAAAELDFSGPEYKPAALGEALKICDRAEAAIKATRAFAYGEADRGIQIPEWKLVDKRPTERWLDAQAAIDAVQLEGVAKADCYKPKDVRTPAQIRGELEPFMEGKTKKARLSAAQNFLSEFTEKVSSGTTLVSVDDKRPAVNGRSDASADFDPLD